MYSTTLHGQTSVGSDGQDITASSSDQISESEVK